jgi:RNA polymerase sigma-70 factor
MSQNEPTAAAVFEILVREHSTMLSAYLRSLIGGGPSVDDLFQEAMMVAWRRLAEYDRTRPFGPWLRGIARNLALNHMRQSATRPTATDPTVLAELDRRYDRFVKPGDSFPERLERMRECIQRLPALLREVVDLGYARGLMLGEIAKAVSASEEAVKKRVQRARLALADCIESNDAHLQHETERGAV